METPFFTPLDQALFDSRIVQVTGVIDSESAYQINRALLALEKANSEAAVYLFINSPGGEISSGFSIYDTARFIKCPVVTLVTGLAASMGSLIALCSEKSKRFAFPNAKFMIHQPLISGVVHGSASEIEINAKEIIRTKEKINRIYAAETGRPIEEVISATDRDTWMTADEALKFGLIAKIVTNRADL